MAVFRAKLAIVLGIAILIFVPSAAFGADGDLDGSFDGDGKLTTVIGPDGNDHATALAVQDDGKIFAAGSCGVVSFDFCVARYNPNGSLDMSFDGDGKVTTGIFQDDGVADIAVQPDGKIVAAGTCFGSSFDFCVVRYNPGGSLDTSFDGDGKASTAFGVAGDSVGAVALQPDGKIILAGVCAVGVQNVFCLARFMPDGTLDPLFDLDGKAITGMGSQALTVSSALVQTGGLITVVGTCRFGTVMFCLARFQTNGSVDPFFAGTGKVMTPIGNGSGDVANAGALQPDGKVVAAGHCFLGDDFHIEHCLARYNTNGTLDSSFDGDGIVTTSFGLIATPDDRAVALAVQGDGKLVSAGQCDVGIGQYVFCLARYNPNGSLDPSFSGDGKVTTGAIGTGVGPGDRAAALALQADGRLVVAGDCNLAGSSPFYAFCLARYGGTPPQTNGPPTDITLAPGSVEENVPLGTTVGTFSSSDPDPGDSFAYELVAGAGDADNGAFAVAGGTLTTAAPFDYEAKSSYSIRIRSTDSGGLGFEKQLAIAVTNANEAPTTARDLYFAFQGNPCCQSGPPASVLLNDIDPDAGTTLSAVLVAAPLHGTLTLNANGTFVYTPNATFSGADTFTYRASDGQLTSGAETVQIGVLGTGQFIDILASVGLITTGQQDALKDKLAKADEFFRAGKVPAACDKLDAYITQVNGLPRLAASTRDPLVAAATSLKRLYGCPV